MSGGFPLGKTFYVMRHAETDDNSKKIVSGSSREPELTENGRFQATRVRALLEMLEIPINCVVTSAMKRTRETAIIACDSPIFCDLPQSIDNGINERAYGAMEGLSEQNRLELKQKGKISEGEESKERVMVRTVEAVKRNIEDKKVPLFVTHGGNILRLLGVAMGGEEAVDEIKKKGGFAGNCALYEFVTPRIKGGQWQVNLLTLGENKEINRGKIY